MKITGLCCDTSKTSLGQRRGSSGSPCFPFELTFGRADTKSVARAGGYPSPPMSGSRPNPPSTTQEVTGRIQGSYQPATSTAQDAYRGLTATRSEEIGQSFGAGGAVAPPPLAAAPPPPGAPASFAEGPDRMLYGFHQRPEPAMHRHMSYPPHYAPVMAPQGPAGYLPPLPGVSTGSVAAFGAAIQSGPGPTGYLPTSHQSIQEGTLQTSPKIQRKTKGHVASACVPCKKAHLRCDAQRPCSRCLSNGKEDSCVDVQHKKRGRPRLRDDRETKFEPSRFGGPPEHVGGPGRASLYGSASSMGLGESSAPRFPERGLATDANIYPPLLSAPARAPEPAAFLTMNFEIAKASKTFLDVINRPSAQGLKLADLLVASDRDRATHLQRQMQEEQKRASSSYLPRIVGKDDEAHVMASLGFSVEDLARFPLERQEYLSFSGADGETRPCAVRVGLAKQDAINFVVMSVAHLPRTFQPTTPSPKTRDVSFTYGSLQPTYAQLGPVPSAFDPRQARVGESSFAPRQAVPASAAPPSMALASPGPVSSYAASPTRAELPASASQMSYQIPRSELPTVSRAPMIAGYHLPPIRTPQSGLAPPIPSQNQPEAHRGRDERSRVDIGGLIDRPDSSKHPSL